MKKSPGFWFYTGDWLKDPELRFCSIFARGLLVDLLCYMFESKRQGYLVWPSGNAISDREIAAAITGGTIEEKVDAITELVVKGVLSRDDNGILYSRRLSRLASLSESRAEAGSKGGSKTQAKLKQTVKQTVKQNDKQNDKQNTGVTASVSVTVTDTEIIPPKPPKGERPGRAKYVFNETELPEQLRSPECVQAWQDWLQHRREIAKPVTVSSAKQALKWLAGIGQREAVLAIEYTIRKGWQGLVQCPSEDKPKQSFDEMVAEFHRDPQNASY